MQAVTGEAFSKRKLYSDDSDVIYSFQHVPMLNGINLPFWRGDVLDSALVIELELMTEKQRLPDEFVKDYVDNIIPKILGAIINTLPKTLEIVKSVRNEFLGKLPRLSSFAPWGGAFAR
ncbi:MAG: hypothetical protein ACRECH_00900 [Nitrososphaerales archaeon]